MQLAWELKLATANFLGLAWWAEIKTHDPNITYWFGPFITLYGLKYNLRIFLMDLYKEGQYVIEQKIIRHHVQEPFTEFSIDTNKEEMILKEYKKEITSNI